MASASVPDPADAPSQTTPASSGTGGARAGRVVRRVPFTTAVLAALVLAGIVSGGFLAPVSGADWHDLLAYGLPSYRQGRWWTPVTGTFLVDYPQLYLPLLPFVAGSLGWLEWRRGTRRCAAWFLGGQLAALLVTAGAVLLLSALGSVWAGELSRQDVVGPSAGAFACLTAAVCSLSSPWRGRGRLALAAFSVVSVVFLGSKADVQHAVAIALVLALEGRTRSLPTMRERRFVAWAALVTMAAVQVVTAVVPTAGPFGGMDAGAQPETVVDLAFDTALVALLAHGVRRGYRVAWVLAVLLAAGNVLAGVAATTVLVLLDGQVEAFAEPFSFAGATSVLWALVLACLVRTRSAFRARLRRRIVGGGAGRRADARRIIASTGGGPLSWMGTWPDNSYFFLQDLDGVVAYQVHSGVAIVLADPVAPPGRQRALLADFVAAAERAGLLPCVFCAGEQCP